MQSALSELVPRLQEVCCGSGRRMAPM
jgi:hypothetical protein